MDRALHVHAVGVCRVFYVRVNPTPEPHELSTSISLCLNDIATINITDVTSSDMTQ